MHDDIRSRSVRLSRRRPVRRGVSSVLSMMFLVIFGSLGAAMAVVAQGNLRTADSALRVARAGSAAETGMVFASRRLTLEAARFVVRRGVVDAKFAEQLWRGTYSPTGPGDLVILPPEGYETTSPPVGIAQAILDAHFVDEGTVALEPGDGMLPAFDEVSGQIDAAPMRLGTAADDPTFRISYRFVPDTSRILIVSEGRDGDVRRTLQMQFELDKRIEYAVLSPNRLMIGKNVVVEGPLGTTYGLADGELNATHGHPLLLRSDFNYLDDVLDGSLQILAEAIAAHDVDGDNRLRTQHPLEMVALAGSPALVDHDGDEYVDDFDLFLGRFDLDGDGRVVWDASRAAAAGHGALDVEFSGIDDQLARLLDRARSDRDGDGLVDEADRRLGWDDGIVDALDRVAKIRGDVRLAVSESDWEDAAGASWQTLVRGTIRAGEAAPTTFAIPPEDFRVITTDMFSDTATWFGGRADGDFALQVAQGVSGGGTFTPADEADWEEVPFGSPNAYDWYRRPVYEGMTFRNVRIPAGTNALFRDCTFEGVTYLETETNCEDVHWNYAGAMERIEGAEDSEPIFAVRYPDIVAAIPGSPDPVTDTKAVSNNLRFDGCTFLGSIAGDTPAAYTHWRNKVQFSGPTRLFNDPDDPDLLSQPDGPLLAAALSSLSENDLKELRKSSMMLPGWSVDVGNFSNEQAEDPDDTARIRMSGTVVAGILDIRGTADLHGTLLMTFQPIEGQGPLHFGGKPDAFNTTIGYFGSLDGDFEGSTPGEDTFEGFGEISLRWDPDADLPDGIPWPIHVVPLPESYREARTES
ncbi:MAG: hypothetical protein ACO3P9_09110 [Phycisphaerales bacterium]|jgi:hypothetical protein